MSKQVVRVLVLVGLFFVSVGLVLGFMSVSRGGVNCGSGFMPTRAGDVQDITNSMTGFGVTSTGDECRAATSDRKTFALAAIVPGGVLMFVVWMLAPVKTRNAPPAEADGANPVDNGAKPVDS